MANDAGGAGGTNGRPRKRTKPRYNPKASLDKSQVVVVSKTPPISDKPTGQRAKPKPTPRRGRKKK